MRRMHLVLDFVSTPYVEFLVWALRPRPVVCELFMAYLCFFGWTLTVGFVSNHTKTLFFGEQWGWEAHTFVFCLNLLNGIYHFFYFFPRVHDRAVCVRGVVA